MNRRSSTAALAVLAVLSLALTACGSDDESEATTGGAPVQSEAADGDALNLADVCPATVVMQQDWQPEAEHGAMYALVGEGYTVDNKNKSVTGPLVVDGVDTGVKIEVRTGGPAVGYQPVTALMYLDKDILLGAVTTDAAMASPDQPTVAVTSQLTTSPQMLMWDPESHPDATTIEDAASEGDPIVTSGDVIPALLKSQGLIEDSQIDLSYEGTPQRFVSDPAILQQGFATAEPYIYENEISQWGKPVDYQLLSEIGYNVYPEPLAVRADDVTGQADCLKKLVPIMQQAQIDYLEEPTYANGVIVDIVEKYQTGWTYSEGVAEYAAEQMDELDLITDDPASGVFGQFDPARMQEIVDTFGPVLETGGAAGAADIDPTTLYTNEFIDDSISIGK
jgi:hypothetical protein